MSYIKFFDEITLEDLPSVGGKNASLGYMISTLQKANIPIPYGFSITAQAYKDHLHNNNLYPLLKEQLNLLKKNDSLLPQVGSTIRHAIESAPLSTELTKEIIQAYKKLSALYETKQCNVAVRSSATAEDLPNASFAGQQDTFLHIKGENELLKACKKAFASLFTDRALIYREEKGFDHLKVALSIGVQKMVNADAGCSGVMFTLDPDTGFKEIIFINASYGLGENIVQGTVTPDEFCVFKPLFKQGFKPLIKKQCGSKSKKLVYNTSSQTLEEKPITTLQQHQFSLQEDEIFELARMGLIIEELYSQKNGHWTPMDIEWAKDGDDHKLYIVQARFETVHSQKPQQNSFTSFSFTQPITQSPLLTGQAIGQFITSGKVRLIKSLEDKNISFNEGDILVTSMTTPDWLPLIKKASALVTNQGGRTCHTAIVSRELGIPAIIGTEKATKVLKEGQDITLDGSKGSEGTIYAGKIPFNRHTTLLQELPSNPVPVLLNLADPDQACARSFLPVDGIGLARTEFIISNSIKIHPRACLELEKLDPEIQKQIKTVSAAYDTPAQFFVNRLAQGIGMLAAAFYPRPVIIRLTDLKSNEYRNLIGGAFFEPHEENPMLGFRGASRYIHPSYQQAFALECAALTKARKEMGFTNIKIMIPFVRTVEEAQKAIQLLQHNELEGGKNNLELFMMVEIPSNIIVFEQFAPLFDGFSIGSNDLTQLTLGIDRDSGLLQNIADERNAAVQQFLEQVIEKAQRMKKYISICGQAPSDFPKIADLLIKKGISALSLNPDAVIPFLMRYK